MKTATLLLVSTLTTAAGAQVIDPVPEPILADGLTVKILDWVQIPQSGTPLAAPRINLLYHPRDDSGRLFVNDLRGKLYVIDRGATNLYLDLRGMHPDFVDSPGRGTGFHSFSFHPDFASNGKLYTVHTESPVAGVADLVSPTTTTPALHSVIVEWTVTDPGADAYAGSRREVLRIEQPATIHSVQEIGFNPNALPADADYGLLYIAQGDGGERFTTNPQGLDSPHGSILRIDPAGSDSSNGQYGIPPDNVFAADGDPNTLAEIWAYGFRNPHRFSWDTGGDRKMLIGDIGESNLEEINIGIAGTNYGWNVREGIFVYDPNTNSSVFPLPPDDATLGYTYPVAQYDHDEGSAVVGGFVYRGGRIPSLVGRYLFGDIVNGRLFHVDADALAVGNLATISELSLVDAGSQPVTMQGITPGTRVDLRFGIDGAGEIYILSKSDGKVRRLVSAQLPDSDADSEPDISDNCTFVVNSDQRDTNGDGIGNACDADITDDCLVNFGDLALLKAGFLPVNNPDADFDGDGSVNFGDLAFIKSTFFNSDHPGPGPGRPGNACE